jgi:hypothetical protein
MENTPLIVTMETKEKSQSDKKKTLVEHLAPGAGCTKPG